MKKVKEVIKTVATIAVGILIPYRLTYLLNQLGIEVSVGIISASIIVLLGSILLLVNYLELRTERRISKGYEEYSSHLTKDLKKYSKIIEIQTIVMKRRREELEELDNE